MAKLTVFYDGRCPLCVKEMRYLATLNVQGHLAFFDIHDATLAQRHPDINFYRANAYLHGKTESGAIITGLDVTYYTWKLVGKGFWFAPLRWPIIKPLADICYRFFAKHRVRISHLLTRQPRCEQSCGPLVQPEQVKTQWRECDKLEQNKHDEN